MCHKLFPTYTVCGHNARANSDIVICFFDKCNKFMCRGIKEKDEEQNGLCPNCNAVETFKHCYWSQHCQIEFDHSYTDFSRLPDDDDIVLVTPTNARCRRCEEMDLKEHPRDPADVSRAVSQIPADYEDLPRGSFAEMQSLRPSIQAFVVPLDEVEEFRSQRSAAMTKLPTKLPSHAIDTVRRIVQHEQEANAGSLTIAEALRRGSPANGDQDAFDQGDNGKGVRDALKKTAVSTKADRFKGSRKSERRPITTSRSEHPAAGVPSKTGCDLGSKASTFKGIPEIIMTRASNLSDTSEVQRSSTLRETSGRTVIQEGSEITATKISNLPQLSKTRSSGARRVTSRQTKTAELSSREEDCFSSQQVEAVSNGVERSSHQGEQTETSQGKERLISQHSKAPLSSPRRGHTITQYSDAHVSRHGGTSHREGQAKTPIQRDCRAKRNKLDQIHERKCHQTERANQEKALIIYHLDKLSILSENTLPKKQQQVDRVQRERLAAVPHPARQRQSRHPKNTKHQAIEVKWEVSSMTTRLSKEKYPHLSAVNRPVQGATFLTADQKLLSEFVNLRVVESRIIRQSQPDPSLLHLAMRRSHS
ncbi:hypothetical protein BDZ45DRAFT_800555 [Acephala macrosclerotiorum]|nr:hypothetical protein BDZ45DRAFT_800555 [Acephala macrosclerotiorum]